MQCKNCGQTVTRDMLFCGNCGCPVPNEDHERPMERCPQCGNIIKEGELFCGECGSKLEVKEAAAPVTEPVPVSIAPKTVDEKETGGAKENNSDLISKDTVLRSTVAHRKDPDDTALYREGKKFLKAAADFE